MFFINLYLYQIKAGKSTFGICTVMFQNGVDSESLKQVKGQDFQLNQEPMA